MHTEHTQVGDSKGATRELIRLQFILTGASCDVLDLCCDLLETLKVSVLDNWGHESVIGLDGNTHVDILELSNKVVHPAGVGLWDVTGGKGSSLDNHVVHTDL